jgi:hypothetical protein
MSIRTSLEEGIKLHRFAGIFPEQFSTEASRHREAMMATDQRVVIRRVGDNLTAFVHDISHAPFLWWQSSGTVDLDHVRRPSHPAPPQEDARFCAILYP